MAVEQVLILAILAATVAMFLWGTWRHDMVAAGALLACVAAGLVSTTDAFTGFGHPAVITVACVLVLSRGLQTSGAIDALTRFVLPAKAGPVLAMAALTGLGAVLSAFMNNVGALALLMPVALQIARRQNLPPGRLLMPLAFGSILGGTTTLIGTPPNLIVSGFRAETGAGSFNMFDFAPVGLAVAATGILFIVVIGWRLVPARRNAGVEGFDTGAYFTEARVAASSKAAGMTLRQIEATLDRFDAQVVGLIRNDVRVNAPNPSRPVFGNDILVIEAEADSLANALSSLGLKLEEATSQKDQDADDGDSRSEEQANVGLGDDGADVEPQRKAPGAAKAWATGADPSARARSDENLAAGEQQDEDDDTPASSGDIVLQEMAVLPGASIAGRSASDLLLRTRYGINLLAVSRQGHRSLKRLRSMSLRAGDLLLVQGPPEAISEFAANGGCVPLAERALRIPDKRKAITATLIMVAAIAGAAFGLVPAAISFAGGVLASMALGTVPRRSVYDAIDWPVIVLLAALIPVAGAMEATGTADLIARFLLEGIAQGNAIIGLVLILVVTMTLSDLMNNAATAAVMCPIAIGTAAAVGANADPYLMAVAIGASCAFLTPIGHQNNTLILGPGGFRFGDYWRLGLPVQILVLAVSVPMLLWVWPL